MKKVDIDDISLTDDLNKLTTHHHQKNRKANKVLNFDEFDRLTKKMLKKQELTAEEVEVFEKLSQVYTVLVHYPEKSQAFKVIQRLIGCTKGQALTWINNATNFFGEIAQVTRKAKAFLIEKKLEAMMEHADMDQQIRIMKLMIDVTGVKKEEGGGKAPKKVYRVTRTTNPRAIKEEVEVTNYE